MTTHTYEVIKQYVFHVDNLKHSIKGRISQAVGEGEQSFMWEISHNYKPTENAGVYYPSATRGKSLREAELLLFTYAENFTGIGVVENENF